MSHILEIDCQRQLTTNNEINQWYPMAPCTFSVLTTKQVLQKLMARLVQAWVWLGTNMLPWMTSLLAASPSTPNFLDAGGRRPGLL